METPHIVSDAKILMGKPCLAGTRISVELILDELGSGESIEDIVAGYPHITREGVLAAIRYAAEAVRKEVRKPTGSAKPSESKFSVESERLYPILTDDELAEMIAEVKEHLQPAPKHVDQAKPGNA
jgi:uncharacterized protein (DUF433 family)